MKNYIVAVLWGGDEEISFYRVKAVDKVGAIEEYLTETFEWNDAEVLEFEEDVDHWGIEMALYDFDCYIDAIEVTKIEVERKATLGAVHNEDDHGILLFYLDNCVNEDDAILNSLAYFEDLTSGEKEIINNIMEAFYIDIRDIAEKIYGDTIGVMPVTEDLL